MKRRILSTGALVTALVIGGTLLVPAAANAHGWVGAEDRDPSNGTLTARAAIRANGDIGGIGYEPQSLEAPKGFPATGPADGELASAGHGLASALDVQTEDRWVKNEISTGDVSLGWHLSQSHKTTKWHYYMTKVGWDPNDPLERSDFALIGTVDHDGSEASNNPNHTVTIPDDRSGYHVIYAVWDVADTGNAFYNVIDVDVSPRDGDDTTPPSMVGNPSAELLSSTEARLRWTPATDDVGVVRYRVWDGRRGDYVSEVAGTATTAVVRDLVPDSPTTLGIEAFDAAGNGSGFVNLLVRTPPAEEGIRAPRDVHSMDTTDSAVDLMWSAGDDTTGVHYEVLRDGQQVAEVDDARFVDTGLPAATWHRYQVVAVTDTQRSAPSEPFSVSTGPSAEHPFTLETPEPGSEHRDESVRFAGHGIPGSLVRLSVTNFAAASPVTTVRDDGTWALTRYLGDGDYTFDLTHEQDGRVQHVIHAFRVNAAASTVRPFAVSAPMSGDEARNRVLTFTGTGAPGHRVTLAVTNFASADADTRVQPDGTWSIDRYVGDGPYVFDVTQRDATGSTTGVERALRINTAPPAADKPFAVHAPVDGETFAPNGLVTFTGVGRVGALVTLDPGNGLPAATTLVRDDATWSVDRYLGDGDYTFTVREERDGTTDTVGPIRLSPESQEAGGPKPTEIVHTTESSSVLVHGIGDAGSARDREGRWFRHSDLQPTGRFVRSGQVVTVTIPADAPATGIRIGLIGAHQGLNAGTDRGVGALTGTPSGRTTTITADRDGMVFLTSTATSGSAKVVVAGGRPVPTFVRGGTSNDEFAEQLRTYADAPMVTVIGDRIFGDFQARTRSAFPTDMTSRVAEWDRVIRVTNGVYGLTDDASGSSKKASHRIYVASPDSGAGYANASNDRIMFQVATGAAADLFSKPVNGLWGLWHEIGHTYEPPAYNWTGQAEVAVNIAPLHVQKASGWGNRLDSERAAFDAYFSKPASAREYAAESNPWLKLFMYDQLRRGFGEEFYPQLNRELRVALAIDDVRIGSGSQKRDLFATTASRIADRDLRPFFAEWGIPLSADAKRTMAEHPSLERAIWANRDSANPVVEHLVADTGRISGALDPVSETVLLGSTHLSVPPAARGLRVEGNQVPVRIGEHRLRAVDEQGMVHVEVSAPGVGREVLSAPVSVSAGNSFRFTGIKDHEVMRLLLDPDGSLLRVLASSTQWSHDSWGSRGYVGFELRSADDQSSIGNWSVRGNQSAVSLAAGADRPYEDGQILVVRHQQAANGLTRYADGVAQPGVTESVQRFRITNDALVRI